MDKGKIDKLLEDISYLRGRFDTIIPEMQKSSSNINTILQLHKEEIDKIKDQQLVFKTKVGVYGALAGIVGGAVVTIIVTLITTYIKSI